MPDRKRTSATLLLLGWLACLVGFVSWRPWAVPTIDRGDEQRPKPASQGDEPPLLGTEGVHSKSVGVLAIEPSPEPVQEAAGSLPPCSIYGIVRRGAEPTSATIEIRRIADFSGPEPVSVDQLFASSVFRPELSRLLTTATAGPDGRFEVPGLTPGLYDLTSRAENGNPQTVRVKLLRSGERHHTDIVLRAGELSLRGRVVRADGSSWRGWVDVRNDGDEDGPAAEAVSFVAVDADGQFVVGGLHSGSVSLRAIEEKGWAITRDHLAVLPYAGELVFVVDERVRMRECLAIVASDRTPIANATWTTWTVDGPDFLAATGISDAEGRFRIPYITSSGDPTRSVFVRVSARGFLPGSSGGSAPVQEPVVYMLARAARIEGTVREAASHRAVAGAQVLVVGAGNDGSASATTDGRGRFEIGEVAAGDAFLVVAGGGWISANPVDELKEALARTTVQLVAGEAVHRDLEVLRSPVLEGRVVDEAGLPVPDASVIVEVAQRQTPQMWRTILGAIDAGGGSVDRRSLGKKLASFLTLNTSTDDAGKFRHDGMFPGITYTFRERHADQESPETDVVLQAGERKSADLHLSSRR